MTDDAAAPLPAGLPVASGVVIPYSELTIRAITGSGPGGQHVNRSATRITLQWNVRQTRALSESQRARVLERLASRLEADGGLRLVAGEFRSQQQNRRAAIVRLQELVSRALRVTPPRKATKPTRGSVERRLQAKRERGETKRQRRSGDTD